MTFTFTPTRTYHLLWRLDPPEGEEGYGLAATNENYARVQTTPTVLTLEHSSDGIAKITGPGANDVLTLFDAAGKTVVVPKATIQEAWRQEFKIDHTTANDRDGFFIQSRTRASGPWERLRGEGLDSWIVRWSNADSDIERWRLSPTEVSATITLDNGTLKIGGSTQPGAGLADWWNCFTLKNGTGKALTYKDSANEEHTVAVGADVLIIPKGSGDERTASFSIGDDLTQISLTMTRTVRF